MMRFLDMMMKRIGTTKHDKRKVAVYFSVLLLLLHLALYIEKSVRGWLQRTGVVQKTKNNYRAEEIYQCTNFSGIYWEAREKAGMSLSGRNFPSPRLCSGKN